MSITEDYIQGSLSMACFVAVVTIGIGADLYNMIKRSLTTKLPQLISKRNRLYVAYGYLQMHIIL